MTGVLRCTDMCAKHLKSNLNIGRFKMLKIVLNAQLNVLPAVAGDYVSRDF